MVALTNEEVAGVPTPPVNVVFSFPALVPARVDAEYTGDEYMPSYCAGWTWFQLCMAS